MTPTSEVSIVLAVRDGWEATYRLLLDLVDTCRDVSCETIVVDDGSTDESAVALPLMPGLTVVRADQPQGLVQARNQGGALGTSPLLLFIGNGVTPSPGWLEPLLAPLRSNPSVAVVRPAGLPLASDALLVRREAFLKAGGLDPGYRDRLAELDLLFRLEQVGLGTVEVQVEGLQVTGPWGVGLPPSPADEALFASRWASRLSGRPASPQFSVLVPCYNQAHFLTAALDSLRAQTCGDWEALVVDDGSTDATTEVAERYARLDPRIRPFRKPNGGVASALNRGLAEAQGEWICWLSSDDLFLPDKLAVHRDAIRSDPGLRFMHTNFDLHWEETGRRARSGMDVASFIPPVEHQVVRFLQINYFNGITIALRRDVFQSLGGFNEEFRYGQDYDVWLRASALVRSRFIDRSTAVTRLHPGQGTALFTEAGIYDSARAAVAFLNAHPLEALFPALQLTRPDHALGAVVASLKVALLPDSFVARCGYAPALLDRLREFLASAPGPVRELVRRELGRVMALPGTAPEVAEVIRPLCSIAAGGFTYQHQEPLSLLERQVARVEARGDARELAALRRYLKMISDTRTRGLEAATP